MKKKILLGSVLLLGLGGGVPLSVPSQAEAAIETEQDGLPSFFPKDYKLVRTLWGVWKFRMKEDDFSNPEPPVPELEFQSGKTNFYLYPYPFQTKWEGAQHTPFKLKTDGGVSIDLLDGAQCAGESVKMWFDNGEFVLFPLDRNREEGCASGKYEIFSGHIPRGGAADIKDCVEPVWQYKASELIAHHKPVALSQGKNVLLLKSPDERPIKEYQDMVNPEHHPDYFKELKRYYDAS